MIRYDIRIKPSAEKEIRDLPKEMRKRVISMITRLADDPRPPGAAKLSGQSAYRVRVGRYRIVYSIFDRELVVDVVRVAHRRDVYR